MFTGIVTDIGEVVAVAQPGDWRFEIGCGYDLDSVALGASIACAGVCLTVTEKRSSDGVFAVDASAETVSKTTLGDWTPGRRLNLERALRLGDELGGHIVTGHVDGVAPVLETRAEGDSTRVTFAVPAGFEGFVAPKGSVGVDGCSLTVNEVEDGPDGATFGVNLIPHTKGATTLGTLKAGDRVNFEIDVLARYVARMAEAAR